MRAPLVRLLQTRLAALGHHTGPVDGQRGPLTDAAILRALPAIGQPLPPGWQGWSAKRKATAALQAIARSDGLDPGPIDGWWGPQTAYATTAMMSRAATGRLPDWRDIRPGTANPNGWPAESGVTAVADPQLPLGA